MSQSQIENAVVSSDQSAEFKTSSEVRAETRARVQKHRAKKTAETFVYNSKFIASPADARHILEKRGISLGHILERVYELGVIAAEQLRIIPNRYYWMNGATATLCSLESKSACPLEPVDNCEVPGELVLRSDLYALYDYSIAWREGSMSFEEFLKVRRRCKTDLIYFGRDILGKDFHAEPHGLWAELLPNFTVVLDTLRPGYTQEDMKRVLGAVSECKKRLLIASRNAYKSTVAGVWLFQAILFCPDLRALIVSETKPLSRGQIRGFRAYWEIKPGTPTKFNQLFPEYMIPAGKGSELTFESPMSHLDLIQSVESTSMDSVVAGNRADVIIFDDPISNVTVGNETQRNASIEKFDLLTKLLEVGSLGYITLGTPWHEEDLYAELLRRVEEDEFNEMLYRIDPIFTVKNEYRDRAQTDADLFALTEDQVTLLFPSRLDWRYIKSEMNANKRNLRIFKMQNLCRFEREAGAELRCTFTLEMLQARTKPLSYYLEQRLPLLETILAIDTAWSPAATACLSALAVIRLHKKGSGCIAVVEHMSMNRWRISELGIEIAEHIHRFTPSKVILEKTGPWESLVQEVKKACLLRSYIWPEHVYAKPTNLGNTPKAKALRIKVLETMLTDQEPALNFVQSPWNDDLFPQFIRFDGQRKNRVCDGPDAISIGIEAYFPKNGYEQEKSEAMKKAEEVMQDAQNRAAMYSMVFGSNDVVRVPSTSEPEQTNRNTPFNIPGVRPFGSGQRSAAPATINRFGSITFRDPKAS